MTKEESNRKRQEKFLKLSGGERFMAFLRLSRIINRLPTKAKKELPPENFVIDLSGENLGRKDESFSH